MAVIGRGRAALDLIIQMGAASEAAGLVADFNLAALPCNPVDFSVRVGRHLVFSCLVQRVAHATLLGRAPMSGVGRQELEHRRCFLGDRPKGGGAKTAFGELPLDGQGQGPACFLPREGLLPHGRDAFGSVRSCA